MTINEIPNIEHCTVTPVGDPAFAHKFVTNKGWYIHLDDGDEGTENVWKTVVILRTDYDYSQVIICAEADLPSDANICGIVTSPEVTE